MQSKDAAVAAGREKELLPARLEAIKCFYSNKEDISLAVADFLKGDPERIKLNPSRFIHTSVRRLTENYSLHKAPAKGQPIKVPPEVAQEALDILWAGFEAEGRQCYWDNIEDACDASPGLAAIIDQFKCCPKTLLRAMQREEAECRQRVQRMEREFTPENKKARQKACAFLMHCTVDYLRRVFWLDAATIWIVPKDRAVFAPPDADLVVADPRLGKHSLVKRKMKFYILINAMEGPVALHFVSGTTDLQAEAAWMVRAAAATAARCALHAGGRGQGGAGWTLLLSG